MSNNNPRNKYNQRRSNNNSNQQSNKGAQNKRQTYRPKGYNANAANNANNTSNNNTNNTNNQSNSNSNSSNSNNTNTNSRYNNQNNTNNNNQSNNTNYQRSNNNRGQNKNENRPYSSPKQTPNKRYSRPGTSNNTNTNTTTNTNNTNRSNRGRGGGHYNNNQHYNNYPDEQAPNANSNPTHPAPTTNSRFVKPSNTNNNRHDTNNRGTGGNQSPNNPPRYSNYQNNSNNNSNNSNQSYNNRRRNYNNNNNQNPNNSSNSNNYQSNQHNNNDKNSKGGPPGFIGRTNPNNNSTAAQNYQNRYRVPDTNKSEQNLNWRNRLQPQTPPINAEVDTQKIDQSPNYRPRNANNSPSNSNNRGGIGSGVGGNDRYTTLKLKQSPALNAHEPQNELNIDRDRSPQTYPENSNSNRAYTNNMLLTDSPGFHAHNPANTTNANINVNTNNPRERAQYKPVGSPQIGGVHTPVSDHSITPSLRHRPNSNNTNNGATNANGGTNADNSDNAAGDLYGVIYGQSGTQPSVAFPVIKLCLNINETLSEEPSTLPDNNDRRYPVDWLLGYGKDVKEEPKQQPGDEIPETVTFAYTMRNAGNSWKQRKTREVGNTIIGNNASNNSLNSPNIPPRYRQMNASNNTPSIQVIPAPDHNKTPNIGVGGTVSSDQGTWRKLGKLRLDGGQTSDSSNTQNGFNDKTDQQIDSNNNNLLDVVNINNDETQREVDVMSLNINTMSLARTYEEQKKMDNMIDENVMNPSDEMKDEMGLNLNNLGSNDDIMNEINAYQPRIGDATGDDVNANVNVNVSTNGIEDGLQNMSIQPRMGGNGSQTFSLVPVKSVERENDKMSELHNAMRPEDIEKQLLNEQRHKVDEPAFDENGNLIINENANNMNTGDSEDDIDVLNVDEDLANYKAIHTTPPLKPNPEEIVSDGENPEWYPADDDAAGEEGIDGDFQFEDAVLDKDRERRIMEEQGGLPGSAVTMTRNEYIRREVNKQNDPQQPGQRGPRKPPLHHPNNEMIFPPNTHASYIPPKGQGFPPSQGPRPGQRPPAGPMDVTALPPRIRGIVVRLDEDIAKISSYIRAVRLEPEQLNRYKRHLHKLISRRQQYANWWHMHKDEAGAGDGLQASAGGGSSSGATGGGGGGSGMPSSPSKKYTRTAIQIQHTTSLQQLQHYEHYYKKQLQKMLASASTDPKYNTYVEYYRSKLRAVEKRKCEISGRRASEIRQKTDYIREKHGEEAARKYYLTAMGRSSVVVQRQVQKIMKDANHPNNPNVPNPNVNVNVNATVHATVNGDIKKPHVIDDVNVNGVAVEEGVGGDNMDNGGNNDDAIKNKSSTILTVLNEPKDAGTSEGAGVVAGSDQNNNVGVGDDGGGDDVFGALDSLIGDYAVTANVSGGNLKANNNALIGGVQQPMNNDKQVSGTRGAPRQITAAQVAANDKGNPTLNNPMNPLTNNQVPNSNQQAIINNASNQHRLAPSGSTPGLDDPYSAFYGYPTAQDQQTTYNKHPSSSSTSYHPQQQPQQAHSTHPYQYASHNQQQPAHHQSSHGQSAHYDSHGQQASQARPHRSHDDRLKNYIRHHALKYVPPPPALDNREEYRNWYHQLKKVEKVIYEKYMKKQMARQQQQLLAQRQGNPSSHHPTQAPPSHPLHASHSSGSAAGLQQRQAMIANPQTQQGVVPLPNANNASATGALPPNAVAPQTQRMAQTQAATHGSPRMSQMHPYAQHHGSPRMGQMHHPNAHGSPRGPPSADPRYYNQRPAAAAAHPSTMTMDPYAAHAQQQQHPATSHPSGHSAVAVHPHHPSAYPHHQMSPPNYTAQAHQPHQAHHVYDTHSQRSPPNPVPIAASHHNMAVAPSSPPSSLHPQHTMNAPPQSHTMNAHAQHTMHHMTSLNISAQQQASSGGNPQRSPPMSPQAQGRVTAYGGGGGTTHNLSSHPASMNSPPMYYTTNTAPPHSPPHHQQATQHMYYPHSPPNPTTTSHGYTTHYTSPPNPSHNPLLPQSPPAHYPQHMMMQQNPYARPAQQYEHEQHMDN